ncbi:unnamed protein product [Mytilus edulis]|uniref:C2H2-type domain-containing protein n=1 Tax=Mytilus edulis TaxID=6550 RepID=A0A8S3TQZ9_MYTED|nr:unnamed protein product [Mytilus edulis]
MTSRNGKNHLVRARNQEEARRNLTDKMNEKRGINWHISVSLMKKGVTFESITHVHIFENPTSQDADVTSQIMVDVVTDLVKVLPTLNKFHLFSDNAGCYKSSTTLTQLHSGLGNLLDTYNFSEAQNGKGTNDISKHRSGTEQITANLTTCIDTLKTKYPNARIGICSILPRRGPCDGKASHIKSSIKRYVNEGNDVITAQQMKQAIDQNQQGKYKVKVVNAVTNLDSGANIIKSNIPEITSLHNFKFTEDALVVWKAYNIGEGKTILWTQLKSNSNKELSVVLDWRDVALTRFQDDENESTDMNTQIKKRAIFMCPVEGCVREFSTNSNLDNHLLLGNCDYKLEKQCLTDLAITIYSKKIIDGFPSSTSGQHGQISVYFNRG